MNDTAVATEAGPPAARPHTDPVTAALIVGGAPLVLFGAVLVVSVAGLAVGLRVSGWSFLPGFAAEIAYVAIAWRAVDRARATRRTIATVAAWLIVLIAAGAVASHVADTSTDGRHYHAESVLALDHGWNPVRAAPLHWRQTDPDIWTNAYPKGPWIVMAAVMRAGGDLESTKLVGIVALLAAGCIAFGGFAAAGLGRRAAAILGVAAALNPVAAVQLFTHMVDGITASLVLVALALAMVWVWGRSRAVVVLPVLGAALVILADTKFTGVAFGVVLVGGVVVFGGLVARLGRAKIVRATGALAACLAVAVVAVGYNPYVTNTIRHDSPLYPVYGPHSIDVESGAATGSLRDMSAPQQVITSVFATSSDRPVDPSLKVPFTFSTAEWDVFRTGQVRMGGFGPWFGGVMLLALVAAAWIVIARVRGAATSPQVWVLLIAAALCAAMAVVTRDGFLARLVPQLWLAPPFAFAALLLACPVPASRSRALAWIAIAVLVVDAVAVTAVATRWAVHDSHRQEVSLRALRRLPSVPDVEFGGWQRAERRRLDDAGVRYHAVSRVTCATALRLQISGSLDFVNTATEPRPISGALLCARPAS